MPANSHKLFAQINIDINLGRKHVRTDQKIQVNLLPATGALRGLAWAWLDVPSVTAQTSREHTPDARFLGGLNHCRMLAKPALIQQPWEPASALVDQDCHDIRP